MAQKQPVTPPKITAVYLRVSTDDQRLDLQRDAAQAYLALNPPGGPVEEFADEAMSGASEDRPAFLRLLQAAEDGLLEKVIVYKLDRLSRQAATAIQTVLRFDRLQVPFVATTQPMFSHGTPFRHAMIAIFAELAEMERTQLIERTRAGMAAAKARGARFGAMAVVTPENIDRVLFLRRRGHSLRSIATQTGLSPSTAQRVANGYRGPRPGPGSAQTPKGARAGNRTASSPSPKHPTPIEARQLATHETS